MKEMILFFSLLFWSGENVYCQKIIKNFDFSILKKHNSIEFIDIGLANNTTVYDDQIDLFVREKSKESTIINIKLSNKIRLEHLCNDYLNISDKKNKKEYLRLYNQSISLNDLFKNVLNEKGLNNYRYVLFNKGIYEFEFGQNKYLLIGASDRQFFRNLERNYWILLEIKDKTILKYYVFSDGYSLDAKCFGDFNNDGSLDYLNWNFNQNQMKLYSLLNDKFILNKKMFLFMLPNNVEAEAKKKGVNTIYSNLDCEKSNWFYEL